MVPSLFAATCLLMMFRSASAEPLKIFLLAGQSNMVGMGSIEHMDLLVHNQTMHPNVFRQTLWNGTAYKERDDVYYLYTDNNQNGKLTIRPGYAGRNSFGPELMVGWTLGDALPDRRVLLIKTAWGGRSLAVDFRPPASGEGEYSGVKPSHYGWEYRQMISDTLAALDHLKDYVPDYDADDEGYEFSGFVWFQGWNDMLNMPWVQEYGFNLANLIRDVRKDLDAPHMPVVIGELGMHGMNVTGRAAPRILGLRAAQHSVTLLPEFKNNTLFVRTAPLAVLTGTHYNKGFHYNGRADTYFYIGQAFGKGMLQLMARKDEKESSAAQDGDASSISSYLRRP